MNEKHRDFKSGLQVAIDTFLTLFIKPSPLWSPNLLSKTSLIPSQPELLIILALRSASKLILYAKTPSLHIQKMNDAVRVMRILSANIVFP